MPPHDKQAQKQGREAKRAAALRENLKRRKEQKAIRGAEDTPAKANPQQTQEI